MELRTLLQSSKESLDTINIHDLLTIQNHSNDFNGTRSEHIESRLRLIAISFGLMAPFWIPIDYLFLSETHFYQMAGMRAIFSAAMIGIALWNGTSHSIQMSRLRMALLMLPPGLFYIASMQLLNGAVTNESLMIGYTFFPYLMVVMLAIFPLTMLEGAFFTLCIALFAMTPHALSGQLFTMEALSDLWLLGLMAGICMWPGMTQLHMLMTLYRQATRDPLTRLVNRRVLMTQLNQQIERTQRKEGKHPLSILLMDLDRFKRVNDTYGHLTGDQVLINFSSLLQEQCKGNAIIGRYGGEEFMIVLPDTAAEEAEKIATSINHACRLRAVPLDPEHHEQPSLSYSVSIGVGQLQQDDSDLTLIERVDEGLYQAKTEGRDRVTLVN